MILLYPAAQGIRVGENIAPTETSVKVMEAVESAEDWAETPQTDEIEPGRCFVTFLRQDVKGSNVWHCPLFIHLSLFSVSDRTGQSQTNRFGSNKRRTHRDQRNTFPVKRTATTSDLSVVNTEVTKSLGMDQAHTEQSGPLLSRNVLNRDSCCISTAQQSSGIAHASKRSSGFG